MGLGEGEGSFELSLGGGGGLMSGPKGEGGVLYPCTGFACTHEEGHAPPLGWTCAPRHSHT